MCVFSSKEIAPCTEKHQENDRKDSILYYVVGRSVQEDAVFYFGVLDYLSSLSGPPGGASFVFRDQRVPLALTVVEHFIFIKFFDAVCAVVLFIFDGK